MARGLKFPIQEVEEMYYLYRENKGADPLRSYCASDLGLCFLIYKKLVFSWHGSYVIITSLDFLYNVDHYVMPNSY